MIKTSIPRLHSYTPKDGSARVHVLHNDAPQPDNIMLRDAVDGIVEAMGEPVAGYFLVAWAQDGGYWNAYNTQVMPSPITPSLLPGWLHTIATRTLAACEARDTFNQMFEWRDE